MPVLLFRLLNMILDIWWHLHRKFVAQTILNSRRLKTKKKRYLF